MAKFGTKSKWPWPWKSPLGVPPVGLDRTDTVEVGEHEDVEELGARSRLPMRSVAGSNTEPGNVA